MNLFFTLLLLANTSIVGILIAGHVDKHEDKVIAAIQDNGCSSHQELSQTKTNADVYNYAALSTSY